MNELIDDLLTTLLSHEELRRRTDYSDLEEVVAKDGRSLGSLLVWAGDKIEKVVVARLTLAPGAVYDYLHFLPSPAYRIPRFICEGMTTGQGATCSVDLYPTTDLVADPAYFERYYVPLSAVFEDARRSDAFSWQPSEVSWVRACASPVFFRSATSPEHRPELHALIRAYFGAWLEIWHNEDRVSPEDERQLARRRDCAIQAILNNDPHRGMLASILGDEVTERIGHALLRGPDESPSFD